MVRVQVNATVSEYRKVDIDSREILSIVEYRLKEALRRLRLETMDESRKDIGQAEYINSDGCWELWENGHGSGYTTVYRKATQEEIEFVNLIERTMTILRKSFE